MLTLVTTAGVWALAPKGWGGHRPKLQGRRSERRGLCLENGIEVWEWPERNGSGLRGGVASEKWRGEKGVTSLSVVKKG
jgi:hypothetical protein